VGLIGLVLYRILWQAVMDVVKKFIGPSKTVSSFTKLTAISFSRGFLHRVGEVVELLNNRCNQFLTISF